eukprot:XP_019923323.1 PREDICTED: uncharacterized protein LOC109618913 [Crassostrea gigas]
MAAVFLCIVIYLLTCCSAYVNLALRKPAFEDNIYIHANVTAGNAVDGRKSNLRGTGGECSMSTEKKRTATWWVNLTSTRSIHDIRIYYMTDNVPWDASNEYTARFLGFSIYISNTTKLSDGKLCYKDTYFTRRTIPAVFNTTCFVHGQYVIYYNERLPGVTYPSDYSEYAFSDLCEVEVYECDNRKYGDGCQKSCGQCVNKTQCDHVIGTCPQGCEAGYKGQMCDQGQLHSVIKVFMDKDVRLNAENVLTKSTAVASMELVYRDVFQATKEIRAQNNALMAFLAVIVKKNAMRLV